MIERIGVYPIERELGRGGMGVVYLGRDPRLDRPVAIKVLPEAFALDPERLARFEREARLLASLRHPNIAGIYGLEEADGRRFLALEYVEGETLAERLARGALPVDEALEVCGQIAAALEAAHEGGVIHRDLKPANVKRTPAGEVKVLDFGLAKGAGAAESSPDLSQSPTMTYGATGAGVVLGTAAYMSPEQARGKVVDRRTDIWSFGCVLYECLTGRQLFTGETASDIIAKILEREPDWNTVPQAVSEKVRDLLRRCLEKDARRRLRDIGDARLELEEALAARASSSRIAAAEAGARRKGRALGAPWVAYAIAAAAIAVAAIAVLGPRLGERARQARPTRLSVMEPEGTTLFDDPVQSAISPDGRTIAFTAIDSTGTSRLWLRPLESLKARPLAGTDDAGLPFWSPDGAFLGFFAAGKLKKLRVSGGAAEEICPAQNGRGASWSRKNVIVFAPAGEGPLYRVSGSGEGLRPATVLDSTRNETAHRFPCFLPDGERFLYVALPSRGGKFDVSAGNLKSTERRRVTEAESAPIFAAPGYLVFSRGSNLVVQGFEPKSLRITGEPVLLPDVPGQSTNYGYRAASAGARALAYATGREVNTRLTWLDRSGRELGTIPLPASQYRFANLSPDSRSAVVERYAGPNESDLWLVDVERGVANRFTYGPGLNVGGLWSHDGRSIVFESNRNGPWDIFVKSTNGAEPEKPILESPTQFKHPFSWSPDGRSITVEQLDAKTGWDIWVVPVDGGAPTPYLRSPFDDRFPSISPDGRWMLYGSNESGRFETYVQSFPIPGRKYRVSAAGSFLALWRRDGKEILVFGPDGTTAFVAEVLSAGEDFRTAPMKPLFPIPLGMSGLSGNRDFSRFLTTLPAGKAGPSSITVVLDWPAALRASTPEPR